MFLLIDEIPVKFGPHDADWWMVWVTGAAALTSLFVAIVAIRNANKANSAASDSVEIARDANTREERRLAAESQAKADTERQKAALAMMRALISTKTLQWVPMSTFYGGGSAPNPRYATAEQEADTLKLEALALVTLLASGEHSSRLRGWFNHMILHVYGYFGSQEGSATDANSALDTMLERIATWGSDATAIESLLATDFVGPIFTNEGVLPCTGKFPDID